MGPTRLKYKGSLSNTNSYFLYIPTDIELSNRLLLSLHSIIALSANPSFSILGDKRPQNVS